ncbi:uncharacterized protein EI97DRAFT_433401 [Westerdykella ornata]|uniref:CST complex subunit Ten1 n=1 Tax=Westerdykella ornata TaxID=318751 RepID=A0A6A6JJD6_WESOR|nr:uncharacterized protein EI97DRAFT_433401 [Westerdykella ornata]KAF2276572.1 hypothetical protein EI97DRAFT_433401 [Westerdykella ornata]
MTGPPPSSLVFLSDLQNCDRGDKVRFLGCVDEYVVQDATLRLKHNYPPSERPRVARVNISVILESIQRHDIDVGCWVNVLGYVVGQDDTGVSVQAIAVWSAGNLDLEAYQNAVNWRKEVALGRVYT